jgi:SAM-dependent methyltransferase
MRSSDEIRGIVRRKYGEIAEKSKGSGCCSPAEESAGSVCGCGCGTGSDTTALFQERYDRLPGYRPEADLGLGCGVPTKFAGIREGDTVLDLGSGAGNDAFVARAIVGKTGRVIGVDMTPEMIALARKNTEKLGHDNVEFRLGEIENLPVRDASADVVISNCVLNLVPDKKRAFAEIHRVLKPGGRMCVSDIVLKGELPRALREEAEMIAGCVAGAAEEGEYMRLITGAGFGGAEIVASKAIRLPDEVLSAHLDAREIEAYRKGGSAILSITVVGTKV